jgi:hypothetical protein
MAAWEYKVEKLVLECAPMGQMIGIQRPVEPYALIEKKLNDLGRDGWELVEISPPPPDPCNPGVIGLYYFKRPKPVIGAPLPVYT